MEPADKAYGNYGQQAQEGSHYAQNLNRTATTKRVEISRTDQEVLLARARLDVALARRSLERKETTLKQYEAGDFFGTLGGPGTLVLHPKEAAAETDSAYDPGGPDTIARAYAPQVTAVRDLE